MKFWMQKTIALVLEPSFKFSSQFTFQVKYVQLTPMINGENIMKFY